MVSHPSCCRHTRNPLVWSGRLEARMIDPLFLGSAFFLGLAAGLMLYRALDR